MLITGPKTTAILFLGRRVSRNECFGAIFLLAKTLRVHEADVSSISHVETNISS